VLDALVLALLPGLLWRNCIGVRRVGATVVLSLLVLVLLRALMI
jgi:hypothetical protein